MNETPDQNIDHATFREQIAAALAGGLSAAERGAFEAHAESCAACAAELAGAREAEQHMMALMADARPAAGLEDRVIQRLRIGAGGASIGGRLAWLPRPNWVHPAVRKAVTGVAAAVVLGGFGYVATQVMQREGLIAAAPGASSTQPAGASVLWDWSDGKDVSGPQRKIEYSYQSSRYPKTNAGGTGFKLNNSLGAEFGIASDFTPGVPAAANPAAQDMDFYGTTRAGDGRDIAGKGVAAAPQDQESTNGAVNAPTFNLQNQRGGGGGQQGGQQGQALFGGGAGGAAASSRDRAVRLYYDADGDSAGKAELDAKQQAGWFKPTELSSAVENERLGRVVTGANVPSLGVDVRGIEGTKTVEQLNRAAVVMTNGNAAAQNSERKLAEVADQASPKPVDGPAPVKSPPAGGATAETPKPPAPQEVTSQPASVRKIIRNGDVEFEVDRFDSAFAQVVKLVQEAGGYVGTTDSEKLPNGKVKGTVTVRVPPDRLDTLVLQLRGIGDLKSQKLEAQDVSKKYSDLDSELRAARAMEERLLAIIKEGKGHIKDLLAAEKELGNWRTKIEQITGELRYFDNLVAMSTLNITLLERNIATVATAFETENIDAGVESEDVEKARAEALKAIEEAKGRVIQSDLKRYDAGQFGATIVAEVPPDRAGALLDRIKQIGKVARLDVQRKQTSAERQPPPGGATQPPVRIEKRDTRLNLSLYNVANVAPRQATSMNVAAHDVEQAYRAIIDRVTKAGGRIVTSNLARNKPEQTTGTISFEVPTAEADAVAADVRASGDVMKLSVADNPDVQNSTAAKRGFSVSLASAASVAPRETITAQYAAESVAAARDKILAAAGAGGARVLTLLTSTADAQNATAKLDLDVKRSALAAVEKALADAGQEINRQSSTSSDTENTLDSKVRLTLTVVPADKLPPRETTTMAVELKDVEGAMGRLQAAAQSLGGRTVDSSLSKDRDGRSIAKVAVEVPIDKAGEIVKQAKDLGTVRAIDASKNHQVPDGRLTRARLEVAFGNADAIVAPDSGILASIRRGLSTSVAGLAWSVQLIVIGLCFVLPWVVILWALWKFVLKRRTPAGQVAPS